MSGGKHVRERDERQQDVGREEGEGESNSMYYGRAKESMTQAKAYESMKKEMRAKP